MNTMKKKQSTKKQKAAQQENAKAIEQKNLDRLNAAFERATH